MKLRNFLEEGVVIVTETVSNFVEHGERRASQQTGLPQGDNSTMQLIDKLVSFLFSQIVTITFLK